MTGSLENLLQRVDEIKEERIKTVGQHDHRIFHVMIYNICLLLSLYKLRIWEVWFSKELKMVQSSMNLIIKNKS